VKTYPSIPYGTTSDQIFYGFDKLDGSNIRAEWSKQKGFYKFGTRKHLLTTEDQFLCEAPDLIKARYGDTLPKRLQELKCDRAVAFFEFYGPQSFSGMHIQEAHQVTLIDVSRDRVGFPTGKDFYDFYYDLGTPTMLHIGVIDEEVIEAVRSSVLQGMTFEGVVFRGQIDKKKSMPVYFKQKSRAWLDKLKQYCGANEQLFETMK
jgi:hypothetical protein